MNIYPKIDSLLLAKYIIVKLGGMNHLKLQKLLYYIESWHLVIFDQSIVDDDFYAWVHGPVLKRVWNTYKRYSLLYDSLPNDLAKASDIIDQAEAVLNSDQLDLIKDVLEEYGSKGAYHLECLTHSEKPWREARGDLPPEEPSNAAINKETMKTYYRSLLR